MADPATVICKQTSVKHGRFEPYTIDLDYLVDVDSVHATSPSAYAVVSSEKVSARHWRVTVVPSQAVDCTAGETRYAIAVTHVASAGERLPAIKIHRGRRIRG